MKTNPTTPHIGKLLKTFFRARRTRKSVLARLMHCNPSLISKIQKKESVQIAILWNLCIHLQHNFFADLASQLPKSFSSDSPIDISKDELINSLQEENKLLEANLKVLEKVLGKNN